MAPQAQSYTVVLTDSRAHATHTMGSPSLCQSHRPRTTAAPRTASSGVPRFFSCFETTKSGHPSAGLDPNRKPQTAHMIVVSSSHATPSPPCSPPHVAAATTPHFACITRPTSSRRCTAAASPNRKERTGVGAHAKGRGRKVEARGKNPGLGIPLSVGRVNRLGEGEDALHVLVGVIRSRFDGGIMHASRSTREHQKFQRPHSSSRGCK